MKIAIIGPQGLPVPAVKGGAIETLIDVIIKENEKKNKLDIDVYTIFDKDAIEESKKYKNSKFIFLCKYKKYVFVRNKFISFFRKVLKINVQYTYAQKVAKELKKRHYDKVVVEGDSSLIRAISKVMPRESIYLHIHHDPLITNHNEFREELLTCNKIIAISNYVNKGLLQCVGKKKLNTEVLLNCTNTKIFNKELYRNEAKHYRKKYGIRANDIVIMFVGRPIQQKGVKELLLAFKELVNKYNNIKLLIVGNSGFGIENTTEYEKMLRNICSGIEDEVIFTGFVHNTKLPMIHSISDIAVVPSIYAEAAGLVVIEALSSGLPLITTDSGGIPEYVNEKCAIILKSDKNIVNSLKIQLEYLILNKKNREDMATEARSYAQRFNEEIYYENYINILNN